MADQTEDHSLQRARLALRRARDGRQRGGRMGVAQCIDASEEAHNYGLASFMETGNAEAAVVMYHAHACVGRMHRYRGEHSLALPAYRRALAVVEDYGPDAPALVQWLAPAYHDCYVEARLLGQHPTDFKRWAEGRYDTWTDPEVRTYAFIHDNAYMGADGTATDPRYLYDAARGAAWYADDPFEKMVLLASMAMAAGLMGNGKFFHQAARLFETATHELHSQEGVALQLLDIARGARELGCADVAMDALARARTIAGERHEDAVQERATREIEELVAASRLPGIPRLPELVPAETVAA